MVVVDVAPGTVVVENTVVLPVNCTGGDSDRRKFCRCYRRGGCRSYGR